jgi:hypothetical protein
MPNSSFSLRLLLSIRPGALVLPPSEAVFRLNPQQPEKSVINLSSNPFYGFAY